MKILPKRNLQQSLRCKQIVENISYYSVNNAKLVWKSPKQIKRRQSVLSDDWLVWQMAQLLWHAIIKFVRL